MGNRISGSMQGAGGVGGLLWMEDNSTSKTYFYFCLYDGNGNVTSLVDADTGEQVADYDYGPFGEPVKNVSSVEQPFRFSTKYRDEETKLYYYGYRYLNVDTGRWLNRDPMEEEGGVNVYGFVGNGTQDNVDVLGLWKLYDTFQGTSHQRLDISVNAFANIAKIKLPKDIRELLDFGLYGEVKTIKNGSCVEVKFGGYGDLPYAKLAKLAKKVRKLTRFGRRSAKGLPIDFGLQIKGTVKMVDCACDSSIKDVQVGGSIQIDLNAVVGTGWRPDWARNWRSVGKHQPYGLRGIRGPYAYLLTSLEVSGFKRGNEIGLSDEVSMLYGWGVRWSTFDWKSVGSVSSGFEVQVYPNFGQLKAL